MTYDVSRAPEPPQHPLELTRGYLRALRDALAGGEHARPGEEAGCHAPEPGAGRGVAHSPEGLQRDARLGEGDAREVAQDDSAGERLGDQVDEIAAHVVRGERAAARRAEAVAHLRGWHVYSAVAAQARTQVQVDVLAVHPELRVEREARR